MKPTADICDEYEDNVEDGSVCILSTPLTMFGKKNHISGKVVTIKAVEDNSFVRKTIEESGKNRILVIDGGGSRRCALMGGDLAMLAEKNEWQGAIIFGCIRDTIEILNTNIGVWALGTSPKRSKKLSTGSVNIAVSIGNCLISPDSFCTADSDGVIFSKKNIVN